MNLTALYEAIDRRAAAANREYKFDCRRGCNHCCYGLVKVGMAEARLIADSDDIDWGRVRERAKAVKDKTVQDVHKLGSPCPLLVDGVCSVYEVRPIRCRSYWSVSEADCKGFKAGTVATVPIHRELIEAADGACQKAGPEKELCEALLEIADGNS